MGSHVSEACCCTWHTGRVLVRTGPCPASSALRDAPHIQATTWKAPTARRLAAFGQCLRCQTPQCCSFRQEIFLNISQEKAYSILQIPRVSFLDQAMHTEACLSLPVLPVKQTGHLNVPPIPSKLCSIRWHRSFAGESNIWLHSLHSWLMPSSARFKWYNLLVTQHISVCDAAVGEKRPCPTPRTQLQGPTATNKAQPCVWAHVSSPGHVRGIYLQPGWRRCHVLLPGCAHPVPLLAPLHTAETSLLCVCIIKYSNSI